MSIRHCTAKNRSVSYETGTGIDGVILNLRIVDDADVYSRVSIQFDDHDEAEAFAISTGYLVPYTTQFSENLRIIRGGW